MQYSVADLYAHIFLYLRDILKWYNKKSISRALISFKEDFYERFEDHVTGIQWISRAIGRKAQHASHSELRYTRLLVEDVRKNQRLGLKREERENAERQYQAHKESEERAREAESRRPLEQEQSRRLKDLLQITSASFKSICVEDVTKIMTGHASEGAGTTRSVRVPCMTNTKPHGRHTNNQGGAQSAKTFFKIIRSPWA